MRRRERIGSRQHRVTVSQHDGTQDSHGNPTYTASDDWDAVVTDWPVEMVAVRGGEKIRGSQVTSETTHVLFGEYHGGSAILPETKAVVNSSTYEIISAMDIDGDRREMRVEMKQER